MLGDFYLQSSNVRGGSPVVYFAGKRVDNRSVEDRLGTAVVENGQAMVPDSDSVGDEAAAQKQNANTIKTNCGL